MVKPPRSPRESHVSDGAGAGHASLVLLVNHQEWTARSVESVLESAGYAVVKAYTGRQATELAARLRPDLVIVDYRLPDTQGLDTCRSIRELPTVDAATPFVIVTADNLSRRERHECFKAGIWEVFSTLFDPVEFLGKLGTFLSARRQVEAAWESTHSDPATGFYNWKGLLVRAVEMISDAQRSGRWTGCVALGLREGQDLASAEESAGGSSRLRGRDPGRSELFNRITATIAEATRDSDPTALLGTNEFIVLAPGTDKEGTALLARRLVETLNDRAIPKEGPRTELEFSAGYYATVDEKGGSLMAQELLGRTVEALRVAQKADVGSSAILPFQLS
jgi:PleD family two-component response regulator